MRRFFEILNGGTQRRAYLVVRASRWIIHPWMAIVMDSEGMVLRSSTQRRFLNTRYRLSAAAPPPKRFCLSVLAICPAMWIQCKRKKKEYYRLIHSHKHLQIPLLGDLHSLYVTFFTSGYIQWEAKKKIKKISFFFLPLSKLKGK